MNHISIRRSLVATFLLVTAAAACSSSDPSSTEPSADPAAKERNPSKVIEPKTDDPPELRAVDAPTENVAHPAARETLQAPALRNPVPQNDARKDIDGPDARYVGHAPGGTDHITTESAFYSGAVWSGGIIPYQFQNWSSFNAATQTNVTNALAHFAARTGNVVQFVPRTTQSDYLTIQADAPSACGGGGTSVSHPSGSLTHFSGDTTFGVAVHELGHAVGLLHEHTRTDRDRAITVDVADLPCDGYAQQCSDVIYDTAAHSGLYDRYSIMQYASAYNRPAACKDSSGVITQPLWPSSCGAGLTQMYPPKSMNLFLANTGTPVIADGTQNGWGGGYDTNPDCASSPRGGLTNTDAAGIIELYSIPSGWTPFASTGKDVGSNLPLDMHLATSVTMVGAPAVASQGAGDLDVFARGSDGKIYHRFATSSGPLSAWDQSVGALPTGVTASSDPATVSRALGSVDVAVRGSDGNIWVDTYYNSAWGGWYSWGNPGVGGGVSAPALAGSSISRLDMFVKSGPDSSTGAIYQRTWASGFSSWAATGSGSTVITKPAATYYQGRLDVIYSVSAGGLMHQRYTTSWASPDSWGGGGPLQPAMAVDSSGNLTVLVSDAQGFVWHMWWTPSGISGFYDLGGLLVGSPTLVWTGSSTLQIFGNVMDDTTGTPVANGLWQRTWT